MPAPTSATANPGQGGVKFSGAYDAAGNFHPQGAGSVGIDHSVGDPTLPGFGDAFTTSPYIGWIQLAVVALNLNRAQLTAINSTGAQIIGIWDDGSAVAHALLVNASVFPIESGQSMRENCELGRLQIYGPPDAPSTQIMIREC